MTTSTGSGVVVLAAHRPNPELFTVQLQSIRDQTRADFRCLIGADGGQEEVRRLVREIVGEDARFEVTGWDDNVGFYLNFERLLKAVPTDVTWIALSDQDDRWYPHKLERLVPHLDEVALATGQARVMSWPDGTEISPSTGRRVVCPEALLIQNQVIGSQTVLRRELLDIALPFPRLRTITQLHDHWLAMCAVVTDGYRVVDEPVQDYIQHGANLVGEVARRHPRTPRGVLRTLQTLADQYEGGHRPVQVLRAAHSAGLGWRRLVTDELAERHGSPVACGLQRHMRNTTSSSLRVATRALGSPDVAFGTAMTLVAGLPGDLLARRASSRAPQGTLGSDTRRIP
jgi:hypothetical protein